MKVKCYSFHLGICLQQNDLKFFIWKRTQLNKRKSWLHPLHLKEYLYICTEIKWILQYLNMLASISLQVIMEAIKWLSASTAVNLTERLSCDKILPHFLSQQGWELKCIEDWSGFCGPKKVKCGDPSNLLQIAKYIGCGSIDVVCVDLGKHYLCTLFIFPSISIPRRQFWTKLLFCWAVTLLIGALFGSSRLQLQNLNWLLIKSLDGEAQSTEMDS